MPVSAHREALKLLAPELVERLSSSAPFYAHLHAKAVLHRNQLERLRVPPFLSTPFKGH